MATPLARLVQVHEAIGHPVRMRLLAALRTGPLCFCQMLVAAAVLSEIAGKVWFFVERMMAIGLLSTPGIAIDGKVVLHGRIPKAEEVRQLLGIA